VGSRPKDRGPWKLTREPREILWAIQRCRRDLSQWPSEWEFGLWVDLERRLARAFPRRARLGAAEPQDDPGGLWRLYRARELAVANAEGLP
jgi:hypothetical protein